MSSTTQGSSPGASHELVTVGRVGVDLYPAVSGVSLKDVPLFHRYLGGTATNVAVAAARYGHRTAVVTRVGAEGFGPYVRQALADFGVDTRYVTTHPVLKTPIVFCELFPPDNFPITFYREPMAPDMDLTAADFPMAEVCRADILWVTGTGFSAEPSRSTTLKLLEMRHRQGLVVLDIDYRPMFWEDPAAARRELGKAASLATAVIGNLEEVEVVTGSSDPEIACQQLLAMGASLVIVKMGPGGVFATDGDVQVQAQPVPVQVVNGLGAGDAFGGALCHGLLKGWPLDATIQFANAAGAYVAAQLACADAMPTEEAVRLLLAGDRAPSSAGHPSGQAGRDGEAE